MIYYNGKWLIEPEIKAELDRLNCEVERLERENAVLREAKRLLKMAVEDINVAEACDTCEYYPVINSNMCQKDDCYKWRYADEAEKLIGGEEDENSI